MTGSLSSSNVLNLCLLLLLVCLTQERLLPRTGRFSVRVVSNDTVASNEVVSDDALASNDLVPDDTVASNDEYPALVKSTSRIFVVSELGTRPFFEDWMRPLLFTLSTSNNVMRIDHSVAPERQFESRDIVFLVQRDFGIKRQTNVNYWFFNTEGPDKAMAESAISNGFVHIIDYCLANVDRLLAKGATKVLWLPIIVRPAVSVMFPRTYLCMVGGANTANRVEFWEELKSAAVAKSMQIAFHEPMGWGWERDFESQKCALVVNIASLTNNPLTGRMRFDVLWQYDIPIISELTLAPDMPEYEGTLHFVDRSELVGATLDLWRSIHAKTSEESLATIREHYDARLLVQERRETQFRTVVRSILAVLDEEDEDQTVTTLVHN